MSSAAVPPPSVLESGETIAARRVVANVNPKLLFQQLVAPEHLDDDFRARIDGYRCASGTFRMNVALAALPDFTCLPGNGEARLHHGSGIIVAPSLAYMERAYFDAKTLGWSRAPIVEMLIPSVLDSSLSPEGMHVASLFCQHANPRLGDVLPGHTWDDHRDEVADLMIATVDAMAPNFARSVLGRRVLSPLDLERELGWSAATSSTARSRWTSSGRRDPSWALRTIEARSRACTCAARAGIPEAASPARRATIAPAKYSGTSVKG
jgi:Phytoene dehydrogenase and related proteins